jgi:hypothetical protein
MTFVIVTVPSNGLSFGGTHKHQADSYRVTKKGSLRIYRGNEEIGRYKASRWFDVRKDQT